jgi:hypothetical protein
MLQKFHKSAEPPEVGKAREYLPATCVTTAVFAKLAKHLAILASFTILGESTGRIAVGRLAIFILVVLAALLHTIGRSLHLRVRKQIATNGNLP